MLPLSSRMTIARAGRYRPGANLHQAMNPQTRRQFIARVAAGVTILPSVRGVHAAEAMGQPRLAIFGSMYNAQSMLDAPLAFGTPIVALCDPDRRNVEKAFAHWQATAARLENSQKEEERKLAAKFRSMASGEGVRVFSDVRRVLDEMGGELDALVVSHYDHLHGIACTTALNAGKAVCTERPLGLRITEARRLRALAAKTGLPTTYRSPGTASGQFRRAMELIEDGVIGEVREAHVWFKRGGPDRDELPQGAQIVPSELDWDAWLGPLSPREFHPDWMAYSSWRETSSGGLGVFGAHTTILPFMALRLRQLWDRPAGAEPIRVSAECARLNRISFPKWERIRWELPARGDMPPVVLTWHHGPDYAPGTRELIQERLRPFGVEKVEEVDALMKTAGSLLVGSKGALVGDDHSVAITAFPSAAFAGIETKQPQRIPRSQSLYRDWIDACRGGKPHILASFDNGGPLSELLMLGNLANLFPEETLAYDPSAGRITNKDEANEHLDYKARGGWCG